eukprot:XP_025015566.1 MACPF domain-containing protein At1g14780 [Ricinus communis]
MSSGVVEKALSSLGKGFDLTSDFRLKYCKGKERLVLLNEAEKRELMVPGFGAVKDVSVDIKCDKGDRVRYQSDILEFQQMSEFFNKNSSVPGKIPSGFFNAMFGFEGGSWAADAAETKYLGVDGYFIVLFDVHIDRYPLVLSDEVLNAVPTTWDPSGLARRIFWNKILTCKSNIEVVALLFWQGITVMCQKKGGDISASSHYEWLPTVPSMPDAIHYNFIPITSLLRGVPGRGFLSHAINLYLRYKPPMSDLRYFLDFQSHKSWAPIHNDLPLGPTTNMASTSPALRFNLMGPKLYVNTTQVMVGKRPVTGMRFYLEGMKGNRLAIHLQHLSNTPTMLENIIDETNFWRGSEETNDVGFIEAISRKQFSHICTAPVKYNPRWTTRKDVTYIVTGAQLHIKKHDTKNVLHLRLLYSKVSNSLLVKSRWDQVSSEYSQKSSGLLSTLSTSISGANPAKEKPSQAVVVDSSVFPSGPPVQTQKLLKFVDISQLCRGPQNSPGHWLVTGAKLDMERGKICLQVKFSLLNICSS